MGLFDVFKKKNKREEILKNKHSAEGLASNVDVLISLARENEEVVDLLEQLQDKVKYFNPTDNKDVLTLDTKISHRIDDLKIAINKAKAKEDYSAVKQEIEDLLYSAVEERIAKAKQRR